MTFDKDERKFDFKFSPFAGKQHGRVRFDPGVPYLYLPQEAYDKFANYMNTRFGTNGKGICHTDLNICKFESACDGA